MATRITAANIDTGAVTADKIAAGAVTAEKVAAGVGGGPKISSITYPGDDTGVDPAGGQQIAIAGSLFESGCQVYIGSTAASAITVNSASLLTVTLPAKTVGSHVIYVINPNGATAVYAPGVSYSTVPAWSTAAGSIGTPYETNSFSVSLSATSDSAVTYALAAGSSLPAGLSLAANGTVSGTISASAIDTTYNFNVIATDVESQSSESRAFSVTYKTDVVTWSSPAAGTVFSWTTGAANSTTLTAASAAGKAITFAVQSGSLPANVTIAGNLVSGTPTTAQANTSVVIRATAADTARYADRTLYFTVAQAQKTLILLNGNGVNNGTTFTDSSTYNRTLTRSGTYITTNTGIKKFGTASLYSSVNTVTTSYLQASFHADDDLGSGDFTVESWVYLTATTGQYDIVDAWSVAPCFRLSVDGATPFVDFNLNGNYQALYSSSTISTNTWHHLKFYRQGGTFKLLVNGVEKASGTYNPASQVLTNSGNAIRYMNRGTSTALSPFYCDDIRIVKGAAIGGMPSSELTVV